MLESDFFLLFFGQVKANLYQHDEGKERTDETNESWWCVRQGVLTGTFVAADGTKSLVIIDDDRRRSGLI